MPITTKGVFGHFEGQNFSPSHVLNEKCQDSDAILTFLYCMTDLISLPVLAPELVQVADLPQVQAC
jgi:hypothetical protein